MVESLEAKLKQIIVDELGVEESAVVPTAKFVEDLGADSLDLVEFIMAMEEAFEIEIPDKDAESIKTVADAIAYIKQKKENN